MIDIGVLELYAKRKELKLSFHAKKRMLERHITEEQIISVIEKPDLETQARTKGCRRAERKLGERPLGLYIKKVKI